MSRHWRVWVMLALAMIALALMLLPVDTLRQWAGLPGGLHTETRIGLGDLTLSTTVHMVLFTIIGLLLPVLLPKRRPWQWLGIALVLAFGLELSQLLTQTRLARWDDATVNVVCVLTGLAISGLASRWLGAGADKQARLSRGPL